MRKLLLASVAMLGGTMALVSVASAQTQVYSGITAGGPPFPNIVAPGQTPQGTLPYTGPAFIGSPGAYASPGPGFGPPLSPGSMTVRFVGRALVYFGVASDSGRNATVTPTLTGTQSCHLTGNSCGYSSGSIVAASSSNPYGTTTLPGSLASSPQANTKLAAYGAFEYARLYPSFDAVAANGLKYGAFLEIRQDNQAPPGGGSNGSISGSNRDRAQLYFRRETTYMGTDNLGFLRFGATDQPTSLFLTGNFENFDDGGWNGDPAIITGNAEVTWPFEDVGNLYTTTKMVYVSPLFMNMFDFGVSWAPGSGAMGEDSTPGNCPYGVTQANGIEGPMLSNNSLGCDSASATSVAGETSRPMNIFDGVARIRGAAGPLGYAFTIGGMMSGHVMYDGTVNYGTATASSQSTYQNALYPGSAPSFVNRTVMYNGYAVIDSGLQVSYGGLMFGGHVFYGRVNGQWALQPNGGRNAFAGLIGASYTMGSNIIGFHLYNYESAGSWTQATPVTVGTSRTENGLAIGDTFTIAPGAYLMLSYLYGTRHQTGVDLLSGAVSGPNYASASNPHGSVYTNNNTRAQGIWAGTMFKW